MLKRLMLLSVLSLAAIPPTNAQKADLSFLTTRAERSNYLETTRYDELIGFLEVATSQNARLHLTDFGFTTEGRALPLVVFGDVSDASPSSVKATNKLRIYVQANIHAGEVCGKEALLQIVRSLAVGEDEEWADSLVVLIAPIYNADGNERISLFNRRGQNGPYGGMGQRPNAQGLDLNRDHIKAKSPEARSLLRLMNEYDPHILVDLHTTNGTQHAYRITYSPPLNANTAPEITALLREQMLPAITNTVREKHGWEYYYYGNLPYRRGSEAGWYTFDHRPRFNNNYVGLRNRIAILSEAYSYSSFEERVLATRYFVEEIVTYAHQNASRLIDIVNRAESQSIIGQSLAVRSELEQSPEKVDIFMGRTHTEVNPYSGSMIRVRDDYIETQKMYEYGTFRASETERVPSIYYVHPEAENVKNYLDLHGIEYQTSTDQTQALVETFVIDSTTVAPREFQQIIERTVYGAYFQEDVVLPAGTLVVPMSQPLARLAFYLLEPRSDDGLVNWAQLDRHIVRGGRFPIFRSVD